MRGLLLPASMLLLAATVALSARSPAADVVHPGSSVAAQLSLLAARLASGALALCGRGLLRLAASAASRGGGGGPLVRAAAVLRRVGGALLELPGADDLGALWLSSGMAALLAECTHLWVSGGGTVGGTAWVVALRAQHPSRA